MYVSGVYCGELWAVFYFYYVPCFSVFLVSKCHLLVHVINSNQNIVKGARWCLSTVYEFTGHRSRLQVTGQARGQRAGKGLKSQLSFSGKITAFTAFSGKILYLGLCWLLCRGIFPDSATYMNNQFTFFKSVC